MFVRDFYYAMPFPIRALAFNAAGFLQARTRYGKQFKQDLLYLQAMERRTEDEVLTSQLGALRKIVDHAFMTVPYYQRTFGDVGYKPGDLTNLSQIAELPTLTKQDVRSNFTELVSSTYKSATVLHGSSGTTGEPVEVLLPQHLKGPYNYATLYRFYSWADVEFRQRRVSVAGRPITRHAPYAMVNRAENQLYVSARHLNDEALPGILNRLIKYRPSFAQGHPSALAVVAKALLQDSRAIQTTAIFTTSETLYPDQRRLIEKGFGGPVFDTYGMGEMVLMASECEHHDGLHFSPEYGYAEVIGDHSGGGLGGELVGTSLQNFAMPLIRYVTGDLTSPLESDCACGRPFARVKSIEGREDDSLYGPNNSRILPLTLRLRMREAEVGEFQVVQNSLRDIGLVILGSTDEVEDTSRAARAKGVIEELLGRKVTINAKFSDRPILSNSGKQRTVIRHF